MKLSSSADANAPLNVQIVYAQADAAWLKALSVAPGTTVGQALSLSSFAQEFPGYAAAGALAVGLYGQVCSIDRVLADGDRIEIYRPLVFDPMESRRRRALHRKAFMIKARNRPKRRKAKLAAAVLASGKDQDTSL